MADLSLDAEEFLGYLAIEKGRSVNTLLSYRKDITLYERFLRDNLKKDLKEVSVGDLESFTEFLLALGYARSSVARILSAVKGLHRFAHFERGAPLDPTLDIMSPRRPALLPKPISKEEVDILISSVSGPDPISLRDRAILEVLYGGGLRISELTELLISDVNEQDGDIALLSVTGKGQKERIVPIGKQAIAALSDWTGEAGRQFILRKYGFKNGVGERLWISSKAKPMSRQTIWRAIHARSEAVGLGDKVTPHTLRHSFASHMLDNGADIRVVQELLGHASLMTTQIYTYVSNAKLKSVYLKSHPRAQLSRYRD